MRKQRISGCGLAALASAFLLCGICFYVGGWAAVGAAIGGTAIGALSVVGISG